MDGLEIREKSREIWNKKFILVKIAETVSLIFLLRLRPKDQKKELKIKKRIRSKIISSNSFSEKELKEIDKILGRKKWDKIISDCLKEKNRVYDEQLEKIDKSIEKCEGYLLAITDQEISDDLGCEAYIYLYDNNLISKESVNKILEKDKELDWAPDFHDLEYSLDKIRLFGIIDYPTAEFWRKKIMSLSEDFSERINFSDQELREIAIDLWQIIRASKYNNYLYNNLRDFFIILAKKIIKFQLPDGYWTDKNITVEVNNFSGLPKDIIEKINEEIKKAGESMDRLDTRKEIIKRVGLNTNIYFLDSIYKSRGIKNRLCKFFNSSLLTSSFSYFLSHLLFKEGQKNKINGIEQSIEKANDWLSNSQKEDGGWSEYDFKKNMIKEAGDFLTTCLTSQSFCQSTHKRGKYLQKSREWIISKQLPDGTWNNETKWLFSPYWSVLALETIKLIDRKTRTDVTKK